MISKSIENGERANDEMPSPLMYLPIVLDLIVCQPPPPNISWSLENSEEENQFIEVEEEKTILENSVLILYFATSSRERDPILFILSLIEM